MVGPLRHRQTKEAETDMFNLPPPRHISTLPLATVGPKKAACCDGPISTWTTFPVREHLDFATVQSFS
jgi:hypothetical protein